MLEVEGIRYEYGKRPVLREIAFSLSRGEMLFILGPNGSGKTTLLKCLNNILKPRGSIYVDGVDLRKLSPLEVARKFGYVPQRGEIRSLNVFDAILLGRKPYVKWEVSEEDIRIVENTIKMLKIEHLALRRINELSGGELQLVLIARALAQQPRYLLLDEPTNNLDIRNQLEVMNLLRKAVKENGISAIVTMHDINLAINFAEKILMLRDGEVFAFGGRDVINKDTLMAVYGIRAEVVKYDGRVFVVPEI